MNVLKYKAKEIGLDQVDDSENHPRAFKQGQCTIKFIH